MANKAILIVEDESDIRQAYREKLTAAGYKVFEANDGIKGLAKAEQHKPELILLDIIMPKMNGLEMLKALREHSWGRKIKVIMLTNSENTQDVASSRGSSAAHYFIKSDTSLSELLHAINDLIGMA